MGATDASILSPDGTVDTQQRGNHCTHTCSIALLATIVPFCVLSILFLIIYASCGHRYLSRRRKEKQLIDLEMRKLGDVDTDSRRSLDLGYSREGGEDGLALGWGTTRHAESEAAGARAPPPPIWKDRPGEQRRALGSF